MADLKVQTKNGKEPKGNQKRRSCGWLSACNPIRGVPNEILPVILLNLLEAWNINTIWPFLPSLVKQFGIEEEHLGYCTGMIGAAFFAGQAITGYLFGRLADIWGRRPILLFGTLAMSVTSLAFGFSQNLIMAISFRFLGGALNGNSPVSKTYIGEVTNEENQARAFSAIAFLYGVGSIVAPSVGGYLSRPAELFEALRGSIFDTFPYLLPMMITSILAFLCLIWGYICVPETESFLQRIDNHRNQYQSQKDCQNESQSDNDSSSDNVEIENLLAHSLAPHSPEVPNDDFDKQNDNYNEDLSISRKCSDLTEDFQLHNNLLSTPFKTIWVYACLNTGTTMIEELGPLYMKTETSVGGLDFVPQQIATVMIVSGVSLLFWQLFVFERIVKSVGAIRAIATALFLMIGVACIQPIVGMIFVESPIAIKVISMATAQSIMSFTLGTCYPASFLIVNNSVPDSVKGQINGIAQTVASVMGMFAPILSGSIFALAVSIGGIHAPEIIVRSRAVVAFFTTAFIFAVGAIISSSLPSSLNGPYDMNKEVTIEDDFLDLEVEANDGERDDVSLLRPKRKKKMLT